MRYLALCCDYDGTLAHDGRVDAATLGGLERLLASGRRLVLVTGRELPDLQRIFPHLELFERVVAENGAVLYRPATREEKALAQAPPAAFVERLRRRGVAPLSAGRVVVATWRPHEHAVLQAIRELGLELQVIFNKGAVMVLPSGVNKATGLAAALEAMGLSPHNAVGVGDAENDHAFLSLCECSAAVANALDTIKHTADLTTTADHGAGVVELIEELLRNDLADREPRLTRHHLLLGTRDDGSEVRIPPYGSNLLLVGTSGSGKSTLATGFMERLIEHHYTVCVMDPEGDYETFPGLVSLGTPQRAPGVEEVLQHFSPASSNVVVNLVGLPIADRPTFFLALLPRLLELRARTGRPHWLVLDETHHLQPAGWEPQLPGLPQQLQSVLRITVHPNLVDPIALATVGTLLVVGQTPGAMLAEYAAAVAQQPPDWPAGPLEPGQAVVWQRSAHQAPFRLHITPGTTERRRHSRKYAEGELPPEHSFYFRGPAGKLNLRRQNLFLFLQLAEGLDDETWLYHLHQGDYSRWFRDKIKDEGLAARAEAVETRAELSPMESRRLIRVAVEQDYTRPASTPWPVAGTDRERKA